MQLSDILFFQDCQLTQLFMLWLFMYLFFSFLSYSSKRIWRDMLALQASPTKSTGSLSRGDLSSPWWSWVRTQAAEASVCYVWIVSLYSLRLAFRSPSLCCFFCWEREIVCVCSHIYTQGTIPPLWSVNHRVSEEETHLSWLQICETGLTEQKHLGWSYLGLQPTNKKCRLWKKQLGCIGWPQEKIFFGSWVRVWRRNVSSGQNHFLW